MTPNPSEPPTLSGGARGRIGPQTAQLSPGHLPASEQAQRPRSHSAGCPRGQAALRGPRRPGPTSPRVLPLAAGQRTQRFSNQGLDALRGHSPGLLTQRVWEEPPRCLQAEPRSLTAPPTPRGRRESARGSDRRQTCPSGSQARLAPAQIKVTSVAARWTHRPPPPAWSPAGC